MSDLRKMNESVNSLVLHVYIHTSFLHTAYTKYILNSRYRVDDIST